MRIRKILLPLAFAVAASTRIGTMLAADLPDALAKYPAAFKAPVLYGKDYIEVSRQDTLLRRFRYWGDYGKELASYLEEAKAQAAKTPPAKMKILFVVFKDLRIPDILNLKPASKTAPASSDLPLKTLSVTDKELESIRNDCKQYEDWIFAWSHGRCKLDWDLVTITDPITYPPQPGWFWPFAIKGQLEKSLAQYKEKYQFMIFCRVPTGGGIAYTQKTLLGAYTISLSQSSIGFIAHEMAHQLFDANLERTEGIRLNVIHGFALYGWDSQDCGHGEFLSTYRNAYYYILDPEIWGRFSTTPGANFYKPEPFTGKAYNWADVRDDKYVKLPRITSANLNQLTGLTGITIDAPMREGYMHIKVSESDRKSIRSALIDDRQVKDWLTAKKAAAKSKAQPETMADAAGDTQLNNFINMMTESAIVLATTTGQWLITKIDLADVYVDMDRIAGRGDQPLPVYGYMAEGNRAMIVMKAPEGLPLPANERGYFTK